MEPEVNVDAVVRTNAVGLFGAGVILACVEGYFSRVAEVGQEEEEEQRDGVDVHCCVECGEGDVWGNFYRGQWLSRVLWSVVWMTAVDISVLLSRCFFGSLLQ